SAVVVADDTQAFVAGLSKLVRDAATWPDMGQAGRSHVERGFRYDTFIARTEAVYREVLGNVQTPGTRGAARV
ncbi:MAG: hypothetical protein M3O62_18405, partial [Pseudomonadota bacterium]|nr:hypothetical protein [Pseudomonadota bacterium]